MKRHPGLEIACPDQGAARQTPLASAGDAVFSLGCLGDNVGRSRGFYLSAPEGRCAVNVEKEDSESHTVRVVAQPDVTALQFLPKPVMPGVMVDIKKLLNRFVSGSGCENAVFPSVREVIVGGSGIERAEEFLATVQGPIDGRRITHTACLSNFPCEIMLQGTPGDIQTMLIVFPNPDRLNDKSSRLMRGWSRAAFSLRVEHYR